MGCKQAKVTAGHEMFVTTDPKYAEACDGDHMYVDYVSAMDLAAVSLLGMARFIYVCPASGAEVGYGSEEDEADRKYPLFDRPTSPRLLLLAS